MLAPLPPKVRDGRMISGRLASSRRTAMASSSVCAYPLRGRSRPTRPMASLKRSRSSAFLMASSRAPIISTPKRSSTPVSASSMARLSAVWPPKVGSSASGRSASMILVMMPASRGST